MMKPFSEQFVARAARLAVAAAIGLGLPAPASIDVTAQAAHRTFASPEEAVRALTEAAKAGNLQELIAIFGPDSRELVDSADPAAARAGREVFSVAIAEGWQLVNEGSANRKTLVIGNESWPFPVPIVKSGSKWQFDTASGKEEIIARRIGRNELQAIATSGAYVAAQRRYAQDGHDGKPAGVYATRFRSDPGTQNGLYWPAARGQKRSPLGDLVAAAAADGRQVDPSRQTPAPFHGYYFKILTGQGASVAGGAKSYVVDGQMSGGFAMVAWPAQYDVTGVFTFLVNQDGKLRQKDLGKGTDAAAKAMTAYNPDASWTEVSSKP